MENVVENIPLEVIESIRKSISIDFLQSGEFPQNETISIEKSGNRTVRFMPYQVTNLQFITFLNLMLEHGLLEVQERNPRTDPNLWDSEKPVHYQVSYIVKKSFFSKQLTPPLLVFQRHHPNKGHVYIRGISFNGKEFSSTTNFFDLPASNISIYGAQLFCQIFGCELPTPLEWEYFISQLKIIKSQPHSYTNEQGELIEIPAAAWPSINADTFYRLSENEWSEHLNYSRSFPEEVWEWTGEQSSRVHYEDMRQGRKVPLGSHEVKAIQFDGEALIMRQSLAPSVPSYRAIEGREHGFRCIHKS